MNGESEQKATKSAKEDSANGGKCPHFLPFALCSLCCLLFNPPLPLLAQPAFMQNPGLETPAADNPALPLGFPAHMAKPGSGFAWSEAAARTGNKGLAFDLTGARAWIPWHGIDLTTGKIYRFSLWYRTEIPDTQAGILQIIGDGGVGNRTLRYPTASAWTQAEVFFQAKQGKRTQYVAFAVSGYRNGNPEYRTDVEEKALTNAIRLAGSVDDLYFGEAEDNDFSRSNLVQNGDFEEDAESAPGWATYPSRINIDVESPFAGEQSARIELSDEKRTDVYSNRMPLKGGAIYLVSYAARASQNVPISFGISVQDPKGDWRERVTLTTAWREFLHIIEMPREADGLLKRYEMYWDYRKKCFGESFVARLVLRAQSEGTVWIDKCVVRMISDRPPLD